MPLCTIKLFEGELTEAQAADLIHRVTEAIIPCVGEKLRGNTWVLIEEIAIACCDMDLSLTTLLPASLRSLALW